MSNWLSRFVARSAMALNAAALVERVAVHPSDGWLVAHAVAVALLWDTAFPCTTVEVNVTQSSSPPAGGPQ